LIHQLIEENGWYGVIVAQRSSGRILAGNHRWRAAKAAGMSELPVAYLDVDDDRAERILLADNRSNDLASYDDHALADLLQSLTATTNGLTGTGWDGDDLDQLLKDLNGDQPKPDPGAQVDRADELRVKWGTALGQVWQAGDHEIMCGDMTSQDVMTRYANPSLIFTSPPYAVGLDYASYDDTLANLRGLLTALAAWPMHPGAYCITNFGDIIRGSTAAETSEPCEYPTSVEYWPIFRAADWILHTRRVWTKAHARVSAPWTASSNRAASDWEHVWTWKRPGPGLNERRAPSYFGVWDTSTGDALDVGKETHPGAFPTILAEWAISVYTNPTDIVCDPFLGTGTTLVACEHANRPGRGVEIDPGYVAVTLERLSGMGLTPEQTHG
jgi:DNA modification methylase